MAHRCPLCWHPVPLGNSQRADRKQPAEAPFRPPPVRATSSRNGERNHLGTLSNIKSDWWATSSRIRGRLRPESAACFSKALEATVLKHEQGGRCEGTYSHDGTSSG